MEANEKENILSLYYRTAFPASLVVNWLRYIKTREFSFTLANEVYIRYITVNTAEEILSKLIAETPNKIDIGGVYVHRPASVTVDNQCLIKELVFDIDLTDYTRECCSDKNMCNTCLPLIKCAVEVLDTVLRDAFGFRHILFVFSGGRGVHCWVSDATAMTLTRRDRSNIADYFSTFSKRSDEKVEAILRKYQKEMGLDENTSLSVLYERLFPKLDVNVTKQIKHLLKSPFCVHPRTGRVCVPLDLAELDVLNLEDIPTAETVIKNNQILKKYVKFFEEFTKKIK